MLASYARLSKPEKVLAFCAFCRFAKGPISGGAGELCEAEQSGESPAISCFAGVPIMEMQQTASGIFELCNAEQAGEGVVILFFLLFR